MGLMQAAAVRREEACNWLAESQSDAECSTVCKELTVVVSLQMMLVGNWKKKY